VSKIDRGLLSNVEGHARAAYQDKCAIVALESRNAHDAAMSAMLTRHATEGHARSLPRDSRTGYAVADSGGGHGAISVVVPPPSFHGMTM